MVCLEKLRQFDIYGHNAGLCAKSSDTAKLSSEVKFDCNGHYLAVSEYVKDDQRQQILAWDRGNLLGHV